MPLPPMLSRLFHASRRLRWTAVAGWMGLIFYMSSRSDSGNQSGWLTRQIFDVLGVPTEPDRMALWEHVLRKTAHFTEYAILALLLAWALPRGARRLAAAWAIATAYAGTDELHQMFVPNRGPSPWDVALDSSGSATAMLATLWSSRRSRG